jgi:hypothetical protein
MAGHDENGRAWSGMGKHGSTGAQRPLRPRFANKRANAVVSSSCVVMSCFEPSQAGRDANAHSMRRFVNRRSRHINSPQPRKLAPRTLRSARAWKHRLNERPRSPSRRGDRAVLKTRNSAAWVHRLVRPARNVSWAIAQAAASLRYAEHVAAW